MSTNSINGILMADIASINGQDVPSGGGGVAESADGVLYFEAGGFNINVPDADEIFSGQAVSLYKAQISSRTDIVRLKASQYHIYALSSDNKLYSMGYTNQGYMGRSTTGSGNEPYKLVECLTSVSKFQPHAGGCWAIKTDGTLWWCGQLSSYAASGDTGQSTTISNNGWKQFQSDTDWVDIFGWPGYPTTMFATKGSSGSEYLYTCGYNTYGRTGLGTTSGTTKPWTRVKSDASTDWAEAISKVDVGYNATLVVTSSGKFFAIGDANYGPLGQGNTTDVSYPVQVGTDTDWATPIDGRVISYCIKTDGTLYASTSSSSNYEIRGSSTDRTYSQVGTDSDYQEIRLIENNTNSGRELIFAKKNNEWYANWNESFENGFMGSGTSSPPGNNTWVTVNEMLTGNDVTATISDILVTYKNNSSNGGNTVLIATEQASGGSDRLLNDYSGASAAFSVRLLDKNYTGNCMTVRRDSDNSEINIGFTANGDLNTSAIANHCGSANGYVTCWFDQSGNSVNATQSTQSNQPQIYDGSAVITANGKPAHLGGYFGDVSGITLGADWSSFEVYKSVSGDSAFVTYGGSTNSQHSLLAYQNLTNFTSIVRSFYGSPVYYVDGSSVTLSNMGEVYTAVATGDTILLSIMDARTNQWGGFYLRTMVNGNHPFDGYMQEQIFFPSDESDNRTGIETNINNYYSIY